jgi:tRNA 2-selenouridine synthase
MDFLVESTERICKRLGPEQTKHAVEAIREDRMEDFIRQVLVYYDKAYSTGLSTRDQDKIIPIAAAETDALPNARRLLEAARQVSRSPEIMNT